MVTPESPPPEGTPETTSVDETAATPPAASEPTGAAEEAMSAFIVGYTGEVGKELVKELARRNTFQKLKLIGRRVVEYEDETISKNSAIEQVQVNFDELEASKDVFEGLQVGFCCLGTTRGSSGKDGQWKIDHDYAVKAAELAKAGGCKQYHLVSSVGANANSYIFYNKLKGQTEEDIKALGLERVSVYRPGLLMCDREKPRTTEWLARKIMAPLDYMFPGSFTNATSLVAKAMGVNVARKTESPFEVFESNEIHKLATEE